MYVVAPSTMKKVEDTFINQYGMDSFALMETAVINIMKHININNNENNFIIICGFGNNGGDALGIARHLIILHKTVKIYMCNNGRELSYDNKRNLNILINMKADIKYIQNQDDIMQLEQDIKSSDLVVDGLFGTGLSRQLENYYLNIIRSINNYGSNILSIDVPSGMNAENGEIYGECVKADNTITFQYYKKGFFNGCAQNYTGNIFIESIGIPDEIIKNKGEEIYTIDRDFVKSIIPKRNKYGHKGTYGRTTIIAGSRRYTGAAYITTEAAVKTGAGLVSLGTSEDIISILQSKFIEAMVFNCNCKELKKIISDSDVVACGPGMGNNEVTLNRVRDVINYSECPIIFDADAINVISDNKDMLLNNKSKTIILTPHPGEMARFCDITVEQVNKNRIDLTRKVAEENNCIIVLKGYNTVISDGKKVFINITGNSAMASGGMGDCLTGIIAGFISQGLKPIYAAVSAVYIHGLIGQILSENMYAVSASDIINEIPLYMKKLE